MSIDGGGGGGRDDLDYRSMGRAVTVNVGTSIATGAARFLNIESFAGSLGTSTVRAGNGTNDWTIAGLKTGSVNGKDFAGFSSLIGGRGSDTFDVRNGGEASLVDGGGGCDVLDFSARTTYVTVDLNANTATGLTTVKNFRMVIGTAEADILTAGVGAALLIGGAGDDTLQGGAGRDVLIGGSGIDTLNGGGGEDILYGARLSYYNEATGAADVRALDMVLQSWNRDMPYAARVPWMMSRPWVLSAGFDDDAAADELTGGGGLDWFVVQGATDDVLTDRIVGSEFKDDSLL